MCSKLYADGELAATPYETDKVLRHRELCIGLMSLFVIPCLTLQIIPS